MSTSTMLPNPSHCGQAPSGLLKLYSRGSGGGYSSPQSSQASCVLKPILRRGLPVDDAFGALRQPGRTVSGLLYESHTCPRPSGEGDFQ